jgi:hypothetical protein
MDSARAFTIAKVFAWIGMASVLLLVVGGAVALLVPRPPALVPYGEQPPIAARDVGFFTAIISLLTSMVATIGSISTILLGWRADRRQSDELKLKLQQLELQIVEARGKANHPDPN